MASVEHQVETVNDVADSSPQEKVTELIGTIVNMQSQMKGLVTELKKLQKDINKLQRTSKKKRAPPNPDRPKTGFARPTGLSDALCEFLKVSKGTEIARTEVTRLVNTYIKEKNLQNPENKREILLDAPLKKLLNPPDNVVVTYFTLQSYMKVHFIASTTNTTPASTPNPTPSSSVKSDTSTTSTPKKKVVVRKGKAGSGGQISVN